VSRGALAAALDRHHRWTAHRAERAIEAFSWNERNFSTLVLSLSPDGLSRLIEIVRRFQEEVVGLSASDDEERDRVYTVALQVFPLSQSTST
jgi:uncharacterized protein (TIGR02147 family)